MPDKTDDLNIPAILDRKLNPQTPATPDERAAFAAKAAPPAVETVEANNAADEAIVQAMVDDAVAKKKAKASNRIGRMIEKKAAEAIPEKFRAWDTTRSRYYDTRKSNSAKKEKVMTATTKKKMNGSPTKAKVVQLHPKGKTKGAAPTKKQAPKAVTKSGTKREKLVAMLKRDNGASLGEILKVNPLSGKTPLATISAMVSVLKRDYKIEHIGEGKGEHRRYKIVG